MKQAMPLPKKLLAAVFVLTSISVHAEDISGLWYGVAPDTTGNTNFDHQTVLVIDYYPLTVPSKITYIYPALRVTCHSDLTFVDVHSIGSFPNLKRVWTFDDTTSSDECVNGTVRITAAMHFYGESDSIYFEWIDQGGNVDNAGTLARVNLPLP